MAKAIGLLAGLAALICCGFPLLLLFAASGGASVVASIFPNAYTITASLIVGVIAVAAVLILYRTKRHTGVPS